MFYRWNRKKLRKRNRERSADVEHQARANEAFLIRIHDGPLQQKLNFYEELRS